jgi:sugar/nucleoside kinase (ribokinase family)
MTAGAVVIHGDVALHVVVGDGLGDGEFALAPVELMVGGAAGTVAVQLALLGHRPRFAGVTGADGAGELLAEELAAAGVDSSGLVRRGSTARIVVFAAGESFRLRVQPGVEWSEADAARVPPGLLHYVPAFPGIQERLSSLGRSGERVIADFGFLPLLRDADALERHIAGLAEHVEIAVLSAGGFSERERERLAVTCLAGGASIVVATLGGEGVDVATADERFRAPAFQVTPVNPLCAGDSFVAGFLAGLLEDRPLADSVRFGQATAAVRISRLAAFASRAEVDARVADA